MRILILCNDFPPLNSIGARRPASWFQWFKKFDAEPIVITKQWNAEVERPEDVLKNSSSDKIIIEENEFGKIIRVPVELIPPEKIFLKHGEQGKKFQRKFLTLIYKLFSFFSFRFDKHKGIYLAAKECLRKEKVDAILISGEPFILFRYGYLLSKEFNIPWIADYRDGWKLNHVNRFNTGLLNRFLRVWEFQFEKKFIRTCAGITAPDDYLGKALSQLHHKKYFAVFNGFDDMQQPIPSTSKTLLLTHTGTLTQGQRVEFLLQAILELHHEKKISAGDLLIQFTGLEYYSTQAARVKNFNSEISAYIKSTVRLPREQALTINSSSDFLIALTEENYEAIFAKVYDYLAAQKPILILPADNGLLSNLISETKTGISFSSKEELKKFLLEQIQLKQSGKELMKISPVKEKVLFYTRENQAKRMVEYIKEITGK